MKCISFPFFFLFCYTKIVFSSLNENEQYFLSWLKSFGAKIDNIIWPTYNHRTGRGAIAANNILPGEPFLGIPKILILNEKRVEEEAMKRKYHETYVIRPTTIRPFERMISLLMREKYLGSESFWYPYIQILPQKAESLLDWSKSELDELQSDDLIEDSLEILTSDQEESYLTCLELSDSIFMKNRTLFQWAWFIIASRSFQIGNDDHSFNLIPFADLLNHNPSTMISWKISSNNFLEMTLFEEGIKKGHEVFNNYGDLTRDRILLEYSFAMEENFLDEVVIEIPLNSEHIEEKRDVWNGSEIDLHQFTNIPIFMQFFRILSANLEELEQGYQLFKTPISYQREIMSLKTCVYVISYQLASHKTKLEEDILLLNSINEESRLKTAIVHRLARKKILQKHLNFCYGALEFIKCLNFKYFLKKDLGVYNARLTRIGRNIRWNDEEYFKNSQEFKY